VNEFVQGPEESALAWLARLAAIDEESLAPAQRRARAAYLAEARRLREQEQQSAKWGRGRA
jgi:hypothetical protein